MEKLILQQIVRCPYCWTQLRWIDKQETTNTHGFFSIKEHHWECGGCKEHLKDDELIVVAQPHPALWARRFSL